MKEITTTMTTAAMFSEDGTKRYHLTKAWDETMPRLAIIMLAPSEASGIVLDNTTMLVLNNASALGYGSVTILNLFATLGDFGLKTVEPCDEENIEVILGAAEKADAIVYAAGVGKATNKLFLERQSQVLTALAPFEEKLYCLTNASKGARFQHPLSPAVRIWVLSKMQISELVEIKREETPALSHETAKTKAKQKKKAHA